MSTWEPNPPSPPPPRPPGPPNPPRPPGPGRPLALVAAALAVISVSVAVAPMADRVWASQSTVAWVWHGPLMVALLLGGLILFVAVSFLTPGRGSAWRGLARPGLAGHGRAWLGTVGPGSAWRGRAGNNKRPRT